MATKVLDGEGRKTISFVLAGHVDDIPFGELEKDALGINFELCRGASTRQTSGRLLQTAWRLSRQPFRECLSSSSGDGFFNTLFTKENYDGANPGIEPSQRKHYGYNWYRAGRGVEIHEGLVDGTNGITTEYDDFFVGVF